VIFNPALAILQQRLEHLERVDVSRPEVDHAAKYLHCSVQFYKDESTRESAVKEIINKAIGEAGKWGCHINLAHSRIKPDGCWWHDVFLILVLELKNSLGLSGDALYQAVVDYTKIVSGDEV
jgi:hypothetical protein